MRNPSSTLSPWLFLFPILLAVLAPPARASGISAEVDRNRLAENETLTLYLAADSRLSGEPDLSPLSKDFEVLSRSSGSSVNIVNGAMTQSRSWTMALSPKHSGNLTIPAIALGGSSTQPIPIQVLPSGQAAAQGGGHGPVFVETEVDAQSPYVQQAFDYRVRLLFRQQPRRATLSDPEVEGATVETEGEDRSSTRMVDGERYSVIERRYRVIPQRSGTLTIRSPRLEADMPDNRPGARQSPFADLDSFFGGRIFQDFPSMPGFGGTRRVVERGPDRTVDVRSQPAGTGDDWLPAESIQLSDQWTPSPPHPRVGEPITRTLTITAQGATAAQLPTLDPGTPEGANVYPEAPKGEDLAGNGAPASTKTLKVAVVPTRAGALTIPEIRLHWWDTVDDKARVAVIPARTLAVEPAPPGTAPVQPVQSASQARSAPQGTAQSEQSGAEPPASAQAPSAAQAAQGALAGQTETGRAAVGRRLSFLGPWPWVSLILALGWIATAIAWVRERRRPRAPEPLKAQIPEGQTRGGDSLKGSVAALRRACVQSDPKAARGALIAWSRARWGPGAPLGLDDLGRRLGDAQGREVLATLDRAVYAPAGAAWDGAEAWRVLEPLLESTGSPVPAKAKGGLPALYPSA